MQDYFTLIACVVLAGGMIGLLIQVLRTAFKVKYLEALTFVALEDKLEEKLNEYNDSINRH